MQKIQSRVCRSFRHIEEKPREALATVLGLMDIEYGFPAFGLEESGSNRAQ